MVHIAHGFLRYLANVIFQIRMEQHAKFRIQFRQFSEDRTFDLEHVTGLRDLHAIGDMISLIQRGDTDRAFAARDRNLDHSPVVKNMKFRDHGCFREIHVFQFVVLLEKELFLCNEYPA